MKKTTKGPSISIIAKHIYAQTKHTEVTLHVLLRNGQFADFGVDRTILADIKGLHRFLVSKNARLPITYMEAKDYLALVVQQESTKAITVVKVCGWYDRTYVTPHAAYGKNPNIKMRELPDDVAKIPHGMSAGNLEEYADIIKPLVSRSRKLRLLLGLQCASILASRVDVGEPTIFHLGGHSGLGKTALIRVAMSLVGRANQNDPKTYASSKAGFEDDCSLYRNALTIIDEMGVASDDPRALLKKIQDLAFHFSSGQGRILSADYRRKTGHSRPAWNQYAISSGEKTLKDIQSEAGDKLIDGVLRRMIDIPVTEAETVFDLPRKNGKRRSNASVLKALTQACDQLKQHYGVALKPFVDWINAQADLEDQFNNLKADFMKSMDTETGWHHAVVSKFAVVCAAGIMGVRAGIIPCSEDSFIKSLEALCIDTLIYMTKPSGYLEELAAKLFQAIEEKRLVARPGEAGDYPDFDAATSLGFTRKLKEHRTAMIMAKRLDDLTGSQRASVALGNHLRKLGKLVLGSNGHNTQPVDLPHKGKQVRCYRVKF